MFSPACFNPPWTFLFIYVKQGEQCSRDGGELGLFLVLCPILLPLSVDSSASVWPCLWVRPCGGCGHRLMLRLQEELSASLSHPELSCSLMTDLCLLPQATCEHRVDSRDHTESSHTQKCINTQNNQKKLCERA